MGCEVPLSVRSYQDKRSAFALNTVCALAGALSAPYMLLVMSSIASLTAHIAHDFMALGQDVQSFFSSLRVVQVLQCVTRTRKLSVLCKGNRHNGCRGRSGFSPQQAVM